MVRLTDLYPTAAEAIGVKPGRRVEGVTLSAVLTGEERDPRVATGVSPNLARDRIPGRDGFSSYARRGDIKYVDPPRIDMARVIWSHLTRKEQPDYDLAADPKGFRPRLDPMMEPQLYDLSKDETTNRIADFPRQAESILEYLESAEVIHSAARTILAEEGGADDPTAPVLADEEIDQLVQQGYYSLEEGELMKERNRQRREDRARRDAERRAKKKASGQGR